MKKIEYIEGILDMYPTWKPSDIAFMPEINLVGNDLIAVVFSQSRSGVSGWPDIQTNFLRSRSSFVMYLI